METNLQKLSHSIERAAWANLIQLAARRTSNDPELSAQDVAGCLAIRSVTGGPLYNRALASGCGPEAFAELARHYAEAGIDRYLVHLDDDPQPRLEVAARRAGLVPYRRNWVRLGRDARPVAIPETDLRIGEAEAGDIEELARIYCRGFDVDESLWPVVAAAHGRDEWVCLAARDGETPAAIGLLYTRGAVGYLAGGVTAPRYRRRGAQAALVAARVRVAIDRGCSQIFSETGEEVAGDPQHSYRNMQRSGFEPIGRIVNLAPRDMVWSHGAGESSERPTGAA